MVCSIEMYQTMNKDYFQPISFIWKNPKLDSKDNFKDVYQRIFPPIS